MHNICTSIPSKYELVTASSILVKISSELNSSNRQEIGEGVKLHLSAVKLLSAFKKFWKTYLAFKFQLKQFFVLNVKEAKIVKARDTLDLDTALYCWLS